MDVFSPEKRSKLMSKIRGHNTGPELQLRRALWKEGLRYRIQYKIGRFKPDLVFVHARLAIFVDGCFWHQCPLHGVIPEANRKFWEEKLQKNVSRDLETTRSLTESGWAVIRFWEHDIESSLGKCISSISEALALSKKAEK